MQVIFLSLLTLYIELYIQYVYMFLCIYVYVGCMYGTRLQMKKHFFGGVSPSPIDIVNRNPWR